MFYLDNVIETPVRYDPIKFFNFNEDNIDPLDSFFALNIDLLPVQGVYTITTEEKRPDKLSFNIYGDTQYWWLLMMYNSILNIQDLKSGLEIKYFHVDNLEDLYIKASLYQKAV